jgi:two-component system cell cycle response regulator
MHDCGGADGFTILVVGNTTATAGIMQRLSSAGFAVVCVRTAEDAQRFSSTRIPAAVFLGPAAGVDPYAIVRRLREEDRLAFVPIFVFDETGDGDRIGRAVAAGADDAFGPIHDTDGAYDLVERVVARVARARSLAQLALLDPLTGLHNRRFMNDRLPAEIARAGRTNATLSLSLVDLDDFKAINDTFGHLAGDGALAAFGRALREGLRSYDVVCRFGGDEFVLLLPGCGASDARTVFAHLRAQHAWDVPGLPAVTFSAGIAQFPDDGATWTDLFEVADRNVRRAKEGGRNRTFGRDQTHDS